MASEQRRSIPQQNSDFMILVFAKTFQVMTTAAVSA